MSSWPSTSSPSQVQRWLCPVSEWESVGRDARAVIDEAKTAGVYVFAGGIDEDVPPALVSANGAVAEGGYPWAPSVNGGFTVLELASRDEAVAWARASLRPVAVTRSYVSSSSIRSPEGGTEMSQKARPNYALERSVRGSSERAAGARTIVASAAARRPRTARPLNADVRPQDSYACTHSGCLRFPVWLRNDRPSHRH